LIVISLDLELLLVFLAFILLSFYDYENMSTIIENFKVMPLLMYLLIIISAFIHLSAILIKSQKRDEAIRNKSSIVVRARRMNRLIEHKEISYLESMSDFIRIYLVSGEMIICREKISHIFERLPEEFIRIHRSYIINKNNMQSFSRESISIAGKELPISRSYKQEASILFKNQN
jgi:DNA-binding LytR/AlgR family response regulator